MRWLLIVVAGAFGGCTPQLDDCGVDEDCPGERQCSAGYCLPVDADVPDARLIDQRVPDVIDMARDARAPDATPEDADLVDMRATDMVVDGSPITCLEGETQDCPEELGVCVPGQRVCRDGEWSACEGRIVTLEQCSGQDDDCDGNVDEGYDVGSACTQGLGACARDGQIVCLEGVGVCTANAAEPEGPELCTRLPDPQVDEDCDGRVDEGASIDVTWLGERVPVGLNAALETDFRSAARLDVAVTANHTAVLARVVGGDAIELRIFPHVADGFGPPRISEPFSEVVDLAAVVTRGRRFVVAGRRLAANGGQVVELLTVDPDGEPVVGARVESVHPGEVESLRLVPTPEDRVTVFVHQRGAPDIRRRSFIDGRALEDLRLNVQGQVGEWDAAARGDESFLITGGGAGLQYRSFDRADVDVSLDAPVQPGRPSMILANDPVITSVTSAGGLYVKRVRGDEVLGPGPLNGLAGEPAQGDVGLSGYVLLSALGDGATVIRSYTPSLTRNGQNLTLLGTVGPAVVASAGPRGVAVWTNGVGEISMRAVWTGCLTARPQP